MWPRTAVVLLLLCMTACQSERTQNEVQDALSKWSGVRDGRRIQNDDNEAAALLFRDRDAFGRWVKTSEMLEANAARAETTEDPLGGEGEEDGEEEEEHQVHVVSWRWDEMGVYVTITLFIVLSGLAKVAFHHAHWLSSWIPESCLLVIIGLAMGGLVKLLEADENVEDHEIVYVFPHFTPDLFFYVLLPPIILEAAYSLYDKAFFDNLPTILIMAVIGTLFNFLTIGLLLYLVYWLGAMGEVRGPFPYDPAVDEYVFIGVYDLSITEVLTFASLISAVDPVAVLAIFQEVGVNPDLYFLLFGESLLNDGVAVVLYNMMNTFAEIQSSGGEVGTVEIALGVTSFLTVALGGLSIGIVMGFLTALITKTTSEVRVVEPLALFGMAYLSYVTAELFHWSGIISLIGCGLVQAHYAFKNISKKSYTTVKYFIKMLSATSDCVIFLFLGIALVDGPHYWHTGFVVWTVTFTLICRFVGVYGLIFLVNRRRIRKVNLQEQFIMAYGGLRGAVGFSLVEMIDKEVIPPAQMFVTTTLAVVMFTIFFQGGTIKFLVNLLDIDKAKDQQRMISEEVHDSVADHIMAGIEVISGKRGSQYFGRMLERYDEKYLMRWFCKQTRNNDLTVLFEELAISDHLCNLYGPTVLMDPNVTKTDLLQRALLDEDVGDVGDAGDSDDDLFGDGGAAVMAAVAADTDDLLSRKSSSMRHPHHINNIDFHASGQFSPQTTTLGSPSSNATMNHHRPSIVSALLTSGSGRDSFRFSRRPSGRSAGAVTLAATTATGVSDDDGASVMGSSLRRRKTSKREDAATLKNAVRHSAFNRYHYKQNRNLVGDDDQELEAHLRKRHASARRMSNIALVTGGGGVVRPKTSLDSMAALGDRPNQFRKISSPTSPTYEAQLLRLPARDRAGVQAILDRQRLRSASICSEHGGSAISDAQQQMLQQRAGRFSRSQTTRNKKISVGSTTSTPAVYQPPSAVASPPTPPTPALSLGHQPLGRSSSAPLRKGRGGASVVAATAGNGSPSSATGLIEDNLPSVVEMEEGDSASKHEDEN